MMDTPEIPDGGIPRTKKPRTQRDFELGLLTAVLSQRQADLDQKEADLNALARELEMLQALMSQSPPAAAAAPAQGGPPWMPIQ